MELVTMTPQLQRVFQDLKQLNHTDRWQILEYLLGQFKPTVEISHSSNTLSVQEILASTRGSWGETSLDEIDRQLADQRQLDWGE
jgi:hypothetical protein